MEADVNNLELLSQAWLMASEPKRAMDPLAKAAELSESGELFLRLARLHMDAYEWDEADAAAKSALDKGGLRQEGHAWLLRGMAAARNERFSEARDRFVKASRFDETKKYASQWLGYVEGEAARVAALAGT